MVKTRRSRVFSVYRLKSSSSVSAIIIVIVIIVIIITRVHILAYKSKNVRETYVLCGLPTALY